LLIGLGAVALGIIALTVTSANALLLSTIGILAVGVVEFSKGTALAAKMAKIMG
jgi:hypothetical protein